MCGETTDDINAWKQKVIRLNERIIELETMLEAMADNTYMAHSPLGEWAAKRKGRTP